MKAPILAVAGLLMVGILPSFGFVASAAPGDRAGWVWKAECIGGGGAVQDDGWADRWCKGGDHNLKIVYG